MSSASVWPVDRRITIHDLQAATDRGERWSMLTSYDTLTAEVFEQAGVRALLVGDTSAEMVLGYRDTLPVTMDLLIPMVQAVVRGTRTGWWWPICRSAVTRPGRRPRWRTRCGTLRRAGPETPSAGPD